MSGNNNVATSIEDSLAQHPRFLSTEVVAFAHSSTLVRDKKQVQTD